MRTVKVYTTAGGVIELAQRTGMMTLPQVVIDGVLVGGYQETAAAAQSGLLDDLLAA